MPSRARLLDVISPMLQQSLSDRLAEVPVQVRLSEVFPGHMEWHLGVDLKDDLARWRLDARFQSGEPLRGCLNALVRLAAESPQRTLDFVSRYGPLGLCGSHHLAFGHLNGADGSPCAAPPHWTEHIESGDVTWIAEPLWGYLTYASRFDAAMQIARSLKASEPPRNEDLDLILPYFAAARHIRRPPCGPNVVDLTSFPALSLKTVRAAMRPFAEGVAQSAEVEQFKVWLSLWVSVELQFTGIRPILEWQEDDDGPEFGLDLGARSPEWPSTALYPVLVAQLALALRDGTYTCSVCGKSYGAEERESRAPRFDRQSFCSQFCRADAARLHKRAWARKNRQAKAYVIPRQTKGTNHEPERQ